MLRDLAYKWKQPIGYFVTSNIPSPDLLKTILLKCIKIASECCLIVKGMICDRGSNNQLMITKLGTSVSKSYFMHNNNHVIVFCDLPHLLKNLYNNLKRSGFKVGEKNVLWPYIVSFYCSDSVLPDTKTSGITNILRQGEMVNTGSTVILDNSILPFNRSWSIVVCTQVICLTNFKCIAPVQHNEPLHPPVPSSFKRSDAIRSLIVIFSPQTLLKVEEENIII